MTSKLQAATHEQYIQSLHNQHPSWGLPLSLDEFLAREASLKSCEFGSSLRCWVLVPADDPETLDFYCSCETFRREAILVSTGETKDVVGYSIASVFTPPHQRRRGYANTMMSLLHEKLSEAGVSAGGDGAEKEDEVSSAAWQGGKDGICSVLFSDIGPSFYAKCGTPGWTVNSPLQTTWTPFSSTSCEITPSLSPISPINLSTLQEVAATDISLLRSSPPSSPLDSASAFFFLPRHAVYSWHFIRSNTYATYFQQAIPKTWGFELNPKLRGTPEWGFVVFTIDWVKSTLKILRFRRPSSEKAEEGAEFLIEAVREEASRLGVEKVLGWNIPNDLGGGKEEERKDSLSAMAWYGSGEEGEWKLNEAFGWC